MSAPKTLCFRLWRLKGRTPKNIPEQRAYPPDCGKTYGCLDIAVYRGHNLPKPFFAISFRHLVVSLHQKMGIDPSMPILSVCLISHRPEPDFYRSNRNFYFKTIPETSQQIGSSEKCTPSIFSELKMAISRILVRGTFTASFCNVVST